MASYAPPTRPLSSPPRVPYVNDRAGSPYTNDSIGRVPIPLSKGPLSPMGRPANRIPPGLNATPTKSLGMSGISRPMNPYQNLRVVNKGAMTPEILANMARKRLGR